MYKYHTDSIHYRIIYEFKPNNYYFANILPGVFIAHVVRGSLVRVTSIAARIAIYLLGTLAMLKRDREISRNTSSSPISI